MNKDLKIPKHPLRQSQLWTVLSVVVFIIALTASAFRKDADTVAEIRSGRTYADSVESVRAFATVYRVLMSPRCMNCHPAGDVPLQGDDSHLHTMLPKRGVEGRGVYSMKCSNCHQETNSPGLHTPPGHPEWHLPPAAMKMVFEGRSPNQLARQLINPKQNGNKGMKQLLEHANDGLVKAGWNPSEGRTLPPVSHQEFSRAWETWIKKGAYPPKP
jgi:hypothetical protein